MSAPLDHADKPRELNEAEKIALGERIKAAVASASPAWIYDQLGDVAERLDIAPPR